MKTIRIAATCTIALLLGNAWAQNTPVPAGTAQSVQDFGGVTDASRSDAGMAMSPTRQQVNQDLGSSPQSAEQRRLGNNTFLHH